MPDFDNNPYGESIDFDFVWRTRKGKKFKLSEMDHNHIVNCIKLMNKEGNIHISIYLKLQKELLKREEAKKPSTSRFELMDFD